MSLHRTMKVCSANERHLLMAAKKAEPIEEKPVDTSNFEALPDDDIELVGWYNADESGVLVGRIMQMKRLKKNDQNNNAQFFYIVRLGQSMRAVVKGGDTIQAKRGDYVGIRESFSLQRLRQCVTNNCAVRIEANGSKKIDFGRTLKKFKISIHGIKTQLASLPEIDQEPMSEEASDSLPDLF